MSNVPESASYDAGIYQLETVDEVLGGVNGKANAQAKGLANRTSWLKQQVDTLNNLKGKGVAAFSAVNSYVGGDQVIYAGNIWVANTTITPGAWNASQWTVQFPTAPQFDNDTSVATTEFVQRAGLHFKAGNGLAITANRTMSISESGGWADVQNTCTVTLPLLSVCSPGLTTYSFTASAAFTLVSSGADTLLDPPSSPGPISVVAGSTLTVVANSGSWYVVMSGFDMAAMAGANWTTPPQFASDTKLATTEFVQRALGNLRGAAAISANTTLNASAFGVMQLANSATPFTITLPTSTGLPSGSTVHVYNVGTADAVVAVNGGSDVIRNASGGAGLLSPLTVKSGTYASLAVQGVTWWAQGSAVPAATSDQFSNDKYFATTEFVQRALGNIRGITAGTANRALAVSDIGAVVLVNPGVTLTLPLANSVPVGSVIHFRTSAGGADRTVAASGSDTISLGNGSGPLAGMKDGDTLSLMSNGSNTWINIGGVAALGNIAQFGASLAANGYQKLPSGLIIQWGGSILLNLTAGQEFTAGFTFPVAFPTAVFSVISRATNVGFIHGASAISNTQASVFLKNTNAGTSGVIAGYFAIGY